MTDLSTNFGFSLEEGLFQQLLTLDRTETPANQPGSSNLDYQRSGPLLPPIQGESQLVPRSGTSPLEARSPSIDTLYRSLLVHLLQAHGGPHQTVPSEYFDACMADFCSANVELIKGMSEGSGGTEVEDELQEGGLVNVNQQRAGYLGAVSTNTLASLSLSMSKDNAD